MAREFSELPLKIKNLMTFDQHGKLYCRIS